MAPNEFGLDRVDPLHNIASVTPASGDKEKKKKKDSRGNQKQTTEDERSIIDAEEGLNVKEEKHLIDFEA